MGRLQDHELVQNVSKQSSTYGLLREFDNQFVLNRTIVTSVQ